jgi:hypothetical protein
MKYHWITIAMEHGAHLNCIRYVRGYRAAVSWKDRLPVIGSYAKTLEEALESLETAIQDDAANECEC